ncbi:zinc ABC transporter ATP-binding protein ZnuC [Notoacmeibacter ruber]|uniref:Zinc ABC transporter ATP-binding protein ZnuC n=2 Tax=Notoacmeibacter ruber TaxID=2670375 RepID=A0A3L7JCN3_9HYPH|nr:zinc ABC transporter ATP-binding protein ZnuC [Notoacmeibacter ruber]RLQ88423.1 zinc ABC transporter ATP-binding protein ZnuC [Notoacmeibacter ruber]
MPLVEMERAGYSVENRFLVQGLDLSISPGEIVTLVGPNGSGKSTTAKLLLGLLRPTEGKVVRAADLRIGYVPQKLAIDPNLPLPVSRFMRLTKPLSRRQAIAALEETGVSHLIDAQMRGLSGGEMQRVLIARALSMKPQLLVLDEPAQGVDMAGAVAIYDLIAAARRRLGCGVLLVSHDLHLVMAQTDRVLCLNGHICCEGTPEAVSEMPEYRALFSGKAPRGLAVYRHQHDHQHLADGRVLHSDGTITDTCDPHECSHHHHSHDTLRNQVSSSDAR